ncbi:MAG: sigma-70 family RNA polymerase sigma factor [Bryobacteraceae bacterium]
MAEPTDRELVSACQAGDRDAFRALFEAHRDRVYSIALRYTADPAAAMDIAQDVFVKLLGRIGEFRGEARFETWLYRLTANACIDYKRRWRRLIPLGELFTKERLTQSAARNQVGERVQEAVSKLSPELRLTVILRYTQGLAYDEIAGVLGISKGTVASRLNRAHKELERRLAPLELEVWDV